MIKIPAHIALRIIAQKHNVESFYNTLNSSKYNLTDDIISALSQDFVLHGKCDITERRICLLNEAIEKGFVQASAECLT